MDWKSNLAHYDVLKFEIGPLESEKKFKCCLNQPVKKYNSNYIRLYQKTAFGTGTGKSPKQKTMMMMIMMMVMMMMMTTIMIMMCFLHSKGTQT